MTLSRFGAATSHPLPFKNRKRVPGGSQVIFNLNAAKPYLINYSNPDYNAAKPYLINYSNLDYNSPLIY